MAEQTKLFLVTGVTGQQGAAVARSLLKKGMGVRGLSRDIHSEKAQMLAALGAELVNGDLCDKSSLVQAMNGIDGVFAMTDFLQGNEVEIQQGKTMQMLLRSLVLNTWSSVPLPSQN